MKPSLLSLLRCPRCDGPLQLGPHTSVVVDYAGGSIEEVRDGTVACACGLSLPIDDHVLSYEARLPATQRAAGGHWADLFRVAWTHGVEGDFDFREPVAPLLWWGVLETTPRPDGDRPGPHVTLADHPLLRGRRRVLDVGCGPGGSSLFLARRGHEVVAIDASAELVRRAKTRSIATGTFVEYVCGQLGTVVFRDQSFEAVVALSSLHHLRALRARMLEIHRLLAHDGVLAVDDHHRANVQNGLVAQALRRWAEAGTGARWRRVDPAIVGAIEGRLLPYKCVSLGDTLPEAQRLFSIHHLGTRGVFLDAFRMAYYLSHDRAPEAFEIAGEIVDLLARAWCETAPEWAEQITFIAEKTTATSRGDRRGNPQRNALRWLAYPYWQEGPRGLLTGLRRRLRRLTSRQAQY